MPDIRNVEPSQLQQIKTHLDLVLLALEAIAQVGSEEMLAAARTLGVQEWLSDRVALWRLRQSSPLRRSKGGRKKLDVDEALALVLVCSYLAEQAQPLLRQTVATLERCAQQRRDPYREALLADYLERFAELYAERMDEEAAIAANALRTLALKLSVDLLFYSAPGGARRLWMALLERSR